VRSILKGSWSRSTAALVLSASLALGTAPASAQGTGGAKTSTSASRKKAVRPPKASGTTKKAGGTATSRTGTKSRTKAKPGTAPAATDAPMVPAPTGARSLSETLPLPPPPAPRPPEEQPGMTLEGADRAWARGVSKEDQSASLALFSEGNVLLKESIFVQAVEKYRQALERWNHPAIHYNLALALMNLDQPVEVHEHLVAALAYGPAPLEKEKFEYARNYKTLVEKQLARVDITCAAAGATVTMDGQPLFVGPGRFEGLVRPGAHSIVATLPGHVSSDQSRTLLPGETTTLDLKLFTSEDLIRYQRRWSAAMPWLVMGAGVAVAGGGAFIHMRSRDHFRAFETGIANCGGCVPSGPVADERSRGDLMQTGAFAGYALGGAALVTGAVLAVLNQPKPYRIDPGQEAATVDVTPLVGAGSGGALATFRF
jgi:hypothetical protein